MRPLKKRTASKLMTKRATMNPALRDFWSTPSRIKTLYGGRMSSKSWDAAANAIRIAQTVRVRVMCARMFQNKIEESVYTLLVNTIDRFNLGYKFHIGKTKITCLTTGSEFLFYGLARNLNEVKSAEGVDILWIEEADFLTDEMWDILDPTIRACSSEIWIIFNPSLAKAFAYQFFVIKATSDMLVRKINYDENQFLNETNLATIDKMRVNDPEKFRHVYLGEPLSDGDRVVIRGVWLRAAVDAHIALGIEVAGDRRIGYDIADDGADKNATIEAHGVLAITGKEWQGATDGLLKSATTVHADAKRLRATVIYDSIGVGASAGAKFNELNELGSAADSVAHAPFNAGAGVFKPNSKYAPNVTNKQFFSNLKAQAWWSVADRLKATYDWVVNGVACDPSEIISISSDMPNLEALIDQLSTPYRDFDGAGRVKVESKIDLKKRGVDSPNSADAFIMAFAPNMSQPSGGGLLIPDRYR